ncbi:hypothetical protein [Massilia sp. DD77]|uniref:hypothetical protein n=1 Tax=Massilia sp. DD77 TaxID=3109349 RepID=UPI002FFD6450
MATEQRPDQENTTPGLSTHGAKRRRLAKAGLGAAGVLWTLEGRAGMTPGLTCASPSASLSGAKHSTYASNVVCNNPRSPGYWSRPKHASEWPVRRDMKFSEAFPCSNANAETYGKYTMLYILTEKKFDTFNLGRHMIATYLNIKSKKINFINEQWLENMWNELQYDLHYSPAPDVYWSPEQVKNYLASIHGD